VKISPEITEWVCKRSGPARTPVPRSHRRWPMRSRSQAAASANSGAVIPAA